MNSATEVNLNQAHLNAIGDNLLTQHDIGISAVEGKCHASSGEISWLTKKASCNESVDLNKDASEMDFGFSQGYHHLISSSRAVDPELERRQEKENGLSICNFQSSFGTRTRIVTGLSFPIPLSKCSYSGGSLQSSAVQQADST